MAKTFQEKVVELEEKRQLESEKNEQLNNAIHAEKIVTDVKNASASKKGTQKLFFGRLQGQTLAILLSLFVILFAYLYATDVVTFSKQTTQESLDKSFVYKGGLENGNFSGNATISDKSGNLLKANFKSGKIIGPITYQKKDNYSVLQTTDKKSMITLSDKSVITRSDDIYKTKTPNFSYSGGWRFAGSWQGNMTFSNKAGYNGSWKNGLPNGDGSYTTTVGETLHEKFKVGVPQNEN